MLHQAPDTGIHQNHRSFYQKFNDITGHSNDPDG
jgi:hypothetical protein